MTPTFSRSDLLLQCCYWAGDAITGSPRVRDRSAADWGLALHRVVELAVKEKDLDSDEEKTWQGYAASAAAEFGVEDVALLMSEARTAHSALLHWLGENPLGINFLAKSVKVSAEASFAWHVPSGRVRKCAPPTVEGHLYADRKEDEFCGTADLVATGTYKPKGALRRRRFLLVVDYKTGMYGELHRPDRLKQLWSCAVGAGGLRLGSKKLARDEDPPPFYDEIILAVLHVPRPADDGSARGVPSVYYHVISPADLAAHAEAIEAAFLSRNSGYLRPGSHCLDDYCDAFAVCPSNRSALIELRRKPGPLTTAEDVGAAHQQLKTYEKTFNVLAEAADAEIRAKVRELGPCPRPDGKTLRFVPKKGAVTVSFKSIEAALKTALGVGDTAKAAKITRVRAAIDELGCASKGDDGESLRAD